MPNSPILPREDITNLSNSSQGLRVGSAIPLQPLVIQTEDGPRVVHYMAEEPVYVGSFPIQMDIEVLPERDSVTSNDPLVSNLYPEDENLAWHPDPTLRNNPTRSILYISGSPRQDITFYASGQVEALKIDVNGNFFVHGRLVETDPEIYQAFRKFLGLSHEETPTLEPEPRDGIETRYQRILKTVFKR